jgi:hypothetical protein
MTSTFPSPFFAIGIRLRGGEVTIGQWDGNRYIYRLRGRTYKVARLVCEAFNGPPPTDKPCCLHINENARNKEVDIYLRLQELWGICIPRFIAFGRVAFCHAIIIEHLEVISYIFSLMTGDAFVEGQYLRVGGR